MSRLTRIIHPAFTFNVGPVAELAPDLRVQPAPGTNGHAAPPELTALQFVDADGEVHVYLLDDGGKQRLLQALAGGIVIADRLPPATS